MRILCAINPPGAIQKILDCFGLHSKPGPCCLLQSALAAFLKPSEAQDSPCHVPSSAVSSVVGCWLLITDVVTAGSKTP
jgi:hypothetical protein